MKKALSLLTILALCFCGVRFAVAAAALPARAVGVSSVTVPKIEVSTAAGNGASLQKADGYVDAQIKITDTDGSELGGTVQFKVRGNSTALESVQKKSFNFKFSKKTEVLGMGKGKKWVMLANAFDPTLLRNYTAMELARELELPYTSQQRFVELWLDGAYHGCYVVCEPVQEGKDRVDIDIESNEGKKDFLIEYEATRVEDDVTYFTVNGLRFSVTEPEEPTDDQLDYITQVMTDITQTLITGDETAVRGKIDVPSFAAYYLLNEFNKTADFGYSSVFFFYQDGRLYAGPAWDYDLALGNLNPELASASAKAASRTSDIYQNQRNVYRWLCRQEWFQQEIRDVYRAHYDFIARIGADGGFLDTMRARYADVIARNFTRWSVKRHWLNYQRRPDNTYDENYRYFKNWCAERNAWLAGYYDVPGSVILGDVDGDRKVTILDATAIQRRLASFSTSVYEEAAADADGSGEVDILDATVIQRWLVGFRDFETIGKPIA